MKKGVGSTGEAALQTGRKFLGVEIDSRYYGAARERLQQLSDPGLISLEPQTKFFYWVST